MTDTWIITLPWAKPPLSLNIELNRYKKAEIKREIKGDVAILARFNKLPKGLPAVDVVLRWHPAVDRRRDTDNPTPTLKHCIDGLVQYGLVADDSSEYVSSHCEIGEKVEGGRLDLIIRAGLAGAA